MKRLNEHGAKDIAPLIKKLEIKILNDKVTPKELDVIQRIIDRLDDEVDEPNFRLYELQSLIFYADDKKEEALEFIKDALELESDLTKYSKMGALLAEIQLGYRTGINFDGDKANSNLNAVPETSEKLENTTVESSETSSPEKTFNGKLQGWLALYTLRLIITPIYLIYDLSQAFGIETSQVPDDILFYVFAAVFADVLGIFGSIVLWYFYFGKKQYTLILARIYEGAVATLWVVLGIWASSLFASYTIENDDTPTKLFSASFAAVLWMLYWFYSKRVKETFIN